MRKEDERYLPYPIFGARPQQYIPLGLLLVHEGQEWKNHMQSLGQLAERGGFSWAEALAIIGNKVRRDAEHDENTAEVIVKKIESEYMKG